MSDKVKNIIKKVVSVSIIGIAIAFSGPVMAGPASPQPDLDYFETVVNSIYNVVNGLVPVLIGIALLVFFWGLISYIIKAGDEEGRKGARSIMIWGLIIMFVIVGVWGIVNLLAQFTGVTITGQIPASPEIPRSRPSGAPANP
jgi:hypothetical protein